jgi:hypothetical protein
LFLAQPAAAVASFPTEFQPPDYKSRHRHGKGRNYWIAKAKTVCFPRIQDGHGVEVGVESTFRLATSSVELITALRAAR